MTPRGEASERMFEAVEAEPWSSTEELAAEVGCSPTNASHILVRLAHAGRVVRKGAGTRYDPYRYALADVAASVGVQRLPRVRGEETARADRAERARDAAIREVIDVHAMLDAELVPARIHGRPATCGERLRWLILRFDAQSEEAAAK